MNEKLTFATVDKAVRNLGREIDVTSVSFLDRTVPLEDILEFSGFEHTNTLETQKGAWLRYESEDSVLALYTQGAQKIFPVLAKKKDLNETELLNDLEQLTIGSLEESWVDRNYRIVNFSAKEMKGNLMYSGAITAVGTGFAIFGPDAQYRAMGMVVTAAGVVGISSLQSKVGYYKKVGTGIITEKHAEKRFADLSDAMKTEYDLGDAAITELKRTALSKMVDMVFMQPQLPNPEEYLAIGNIEQAEIGTYVQFHATLEKNAIAQFPESDYKGKFVGTEEGKGGGTWHRGFGGGPIDFSYEGEMQGRQRGSVTGKEINSGTPQSYIANVNGTKVMIAARNYAGFWQDLRDEHEDMKLISEDVHNQVLERLALSNSRVLFQEVPNELPSSKLFTFYGIVREQGTQPVVELTGFEYNKNPLMLRNADGGAMLMGMARHELTVNRPYIPKLESK